jgi:hypothetical protein
MSIGIFRLQRRVMVTRSKWIATSWILALLLLSATGANYARAQSAPRVDNGSPSNAESAANTLRTIDQLVEQNGKLEQQNIKLEQQNQELMNQLEKLRGVIASQANAEPHSPANFAKAGPANAGAAPVAEAGTGAFVDRNKAIVSSAVGHNIQQSGSGTPTQQTSTVAQGTVQGPKKADDKTELPKGSEGNPAIFGEFNPGRGFTVAEGELGDLNLSGYMAVRYLNQLPPNQSATDHLGRPITVMPRQDFQFHRVMLFSQGWLFSHKFQYSTFVWTVQDTNQVAVGGALYYTFGKFMTLGGGWNAYPGTMSLQGSHPYWESYDRVMADEFFRPYFSQGIFAKGNLLPRLEYRWMIGNNNSNLDVPAVRLDRQLSGGAALTWLPTTGEFGPRGAFGDYENHQNLATRFNLAYTYSPENRQSPVGTPAGNTTLRLADSLNIFDTGALANLVTIEKTRYQLVSASAGMKYHGFWLQGEGYGRLLDQFVADGKLPVGDVRDYGFYVQAADMIIPKRFELYGATSYVFGQYGDPKEFIVGGNYYPWNTRNLRLNVQLINVDHSPVNSTFGFYIGQLTGKVFTVGFTTLY